MEFSGFVAADFDFLKKKDKMTKDEYDKLRNDFKLHFRKFCYEVQKLYHKETNGVLELDKEFHAFTRKSEEIYAFKLLTDVSQLKILQNSEFLAVAAEFKLIKYGDLLTKYKDILKSFLLSNKHAYIELITNSKGNKRVRLLSHEVNTKNYENLLSLVNNTNNKAAFAIQIGYLYNKNECIKVGKEIVKNCYDGILKIEELLKDIL